MYDYIDYVLSNYLSVSVGHSEEEAISLLRAELTGNENLSVGLRSEVARAFDDSSYSWQSALEQSNVLYVDSEEAARSYAKRILWDSLFAS